MKDTRPQAHNQTPRTCYACGHDRPQAAVRPFGWLGSRVVSWICAGCAQVPHLVHAAPVHPAVEVTL